ncbi:relaxase/mobilization nuclease domain-containing protein [Algoriphagus sp. AGSA1]|uniref:relaxase/mobilization nuclease domain-containing protein n=1 Tax=unclassified Algoriphagus TaxID=2641541 RepID=UPI00177D9793|nr:MULTISPECIES: relaxase/mobilization nuclease domain-containing protein [unclassified Algoriphagus]MCE7056247.1 relaxase/mobilization nuclease domain-containing protein [Algoriphagus sp. AGSA1]
MVAKIITGKTIGGVIRYNEQKVKTEQAKLVQMGGFAVKNLSVADKIQSFEKLQKLNKRTKTNAVHISLNFSPKDKVDEFMLQKIAADYLKGIGFENQPYLLYQHFDAAHPHIHLVTTNISSSGKRIETHNLGKLWSEQTRKEIEERYHLVKAEEQLKQKVNFLQSLEKASYSKTETKAAISNITREVIRTYRFTSIPELNAVLGQFNVCAYRGEKESEMYKNRGIIYSVLDSNGHRIGVPIKASSIYSKPTLSNLEKCFVRNKEERKSYKEELRNTILETVDKCSSQKELSDRLRSKGIRPVFRINDDGRLYGVTYVDNVSRTVFTGSSLDKRLSANALSAYFSRKTTISFSAPDLREFPSDELLKPPVPSNRIIVNTYQPDDPTPYELRQKKKKRRKKLHT